MLTLTRNIKCLSLERSQQPELSGSHSLKLSKRESQGVLWRGPGWRVSIGKRGRRDHDVWEAEEEVEKGGVGEKGGLGELRE